MYNVLGKIKENNMKASRKKNLLQDQIHWYNHQLDRTLLQVPSNVHATLRLSKLKKLGH